MRSLASIRLYLLGIAFMIFCNGACADQYTAFSLNAARTRIEHAGQGWRTKEPQVLSLVGINQVEGFVYDKKSGDLILVGHHQDKRAPLTLDDLVVAMRARLRYHEWPLVSIDPLPNSEQTGIQHVRWEGHVENTDFGLTMFAADFRLKQIGMGIEQAGVDGVRTVWDQWLAEPNEDQSNTRCRFWFYPVNPELIERDGVCVVRGLKVAVFTELLAKSVNGKPVVNPSEIKDVGAANFAQDVSVHFDEMCTTQWEFNRLRGLEELVGLSRALEDLYPKPNVSWWLEKYPLAKVDTPEQAELLRREGEQGRHRLIVSGGVHLTALAMKLRKGDVGALREAVLAMRPNDTSLSWSFLASQWIIPINNGAVLANEASGLFVQSVFLCNHDRYADAIILLDQLVKAVPDCAAAYNNRGAAYNYLEKYANAIADFNRALALKPRFALAYFNRSDAYLGKGEYSEALADANRLLEINPNSEAAYRQRGHVYVKMQNFTKAMNDFNHALQIDPKSAGAYGDRGNAYLDQNNFTSAIADFDRVLEVDPSNVAAYNNRGNAYRGKGDYGNAILDFDRVLSIAPQSAVAYNNRGNLWCQKGDYDAGIVDYNMALKINPKYALAYCNRAGALRSKHDLDSALQDLNRALDIDRRCVEAYFNRGNLYSMRKDFTAALADWNNAVDIDHKLMRAYQNLASVYTFRGEYDKAWAIITRWRVAGGAPSVELIHILEQRSGKVDPGK
jgi:tetratricopeptide (TPR) repeat protein